MVEIDYTYIYIEILWNIMKYWRDFPNFPLPCWIARGYSLSRPRFCCDWWGRSTWRHRWRRRCARSRPRRRSKQRRQRRRTRGEPTYRISGLFCKFCLILWARGSGFTVSSGVSQGFQGPRGAADTCHGFPTTEYPAYVSKNQPQIHKKMVKQGN